MADQPIEGLCRRIDADNGTVIILANRARCLGCGDRVTSSADPTAAVACSCGRLRVSGGLEALIRHADPKDYDEFSVVAVSKWSWDRRQELADGARWAAVRDAVAFLEVLAAKGALTWTAGACDAIELAAALLREKFGVPRG